MATQKHSKAAPAASVNESSEFVDSPRGAFEYALYALKEITEERDRVYSLAVAGERAVDPEDDILAKNLFKVIHQYIESNDLFGALRVHIEMLARHAGVAVEAQP